jgi:hypothetical protein
MRQGRLHRPARLDRRGRWRHPASCTGGLAVSAQDKAIASLLFDLSACVRAKP